MSAQANRKVQAVPYGDGAALAQAQFYYTWIVKVHAEEQK